MHHLHRAMQHVPLPSNTSQSFTIPYLDRIPYDNGPFSTFPSRCKISQEVAWHLEHAQELHFLAKLPAGIDIDDLSSLLQSWLCFGLLHEFFPDKFCIDDWLEPAPDETKKELPSRASHVTTARLVSFLKDWGETLVLQPDANATIKHLEGCLQLASRVLYLFYKTETKVDEVLSLYIASVGETAHLCLEKVGKKLGIEVKGRLDWRDFFSSGSPLASCMISRGWCPQTSSDALLKRMSLSTKVFLAHMQVPESNTSHSTCSEEKCMAYQIDSSTYSSAHRSVGCTCSTIEAPLEPLFSALNEGTFPLVSIEENIDTGQLTMHILPYERGMHFVAISHVWADGLGNTYSNALPACQLKHLKNLVDKLSKNTNRFSRNVYTEWRHFSYPCVRWNGRHHSAEALDRRPHISHDDHWCSYNQRHAVKCENGERLLFWIDSICCPVKPLSARELALKKMEDVYNDASAVLVLDKTLECYKISNMHRNEAVARMLYSPWASRLWTLQEATMAHELYFQFADEQLNIADVWFWVLPYEHLLDEDIRFFLWIQLGDIKIREFPQLKTRRFEELMLATYRRRLSKASGEAKCHATLLGLPTTSVLNSNDVQGGFGQFWSLVAERNLLPKNIIFHTGERLTLPRYRWAPSSLLRFEGGRAMGLLKTTEINELGADLGQMTTQGLRVTFPALKVRAPWATLGSYDEVLGWNNYVRFNSLRVAPAVWYKLMPQFRGHAKEATTQESLKHHVDAISTGRAVFITNQQDLLDPGFAYSIRTCLIGCHEWTERSDSIRKVQSILPLAIHKLPQAQSLHFELAYQVALQIRQSEIGRDIAATCEHPLQNTEDNNLTATLYKLGSLWSEIKRVLHKRLHELKEQPGGVETIAQTSAYQETPDDFGRCMTVALLFFMGWVVEVEASYPENTTWIID